MSGTQFAISPALNFSGTPLTDPEKVDCRRFMGYPTYGGLGELGFQGWRFFQAYGLMEYRMNNLQPAEYSNVRYYLNFLYQLETALFNAQTNLDTDQASVWKHNKQEVADREGMFRMFRNRLCTLVGVPPGPLLSDGGNSSAIVI